MIFTIELSDILNAVDEIEQLKSTHVSITKIAEVPHCSSSRPIYSFSFGSQSLTAPCIVYVGGIHGLERIGAEVVLAYLDSFLQRLKWDKALVNELKRIRIIFVPALNPVGLIDNTRSNANGVDLMRNAPVDAEHRPPWLAGGHRLRRRIPWYRGKKNSPMEIETKAITKLVEEECLSRPFSMVLDCHSGFGFNDRLWFPYAYSRRPIENIAEYFSLKGLLNQTYPHLDYVFEPQAHSYTSHGDIWDYLYLKSQTQKTTTFLPITMEMGSWRWVKKNPKQLARISGIFNPVKPHRLARVLRRHTVLMDFLINATREWEQWVPQQTERKTINEQATGYWYPKD